MTATPKLRMTVDEFLVWAEDRPGRHELYDGDVFTRSPQRVRQAETRFSVHVALRSAIRRDGLPCHMLPNGLTVRIDRTTAFEPDALVYCGDPVDPDAIEIQNPVIVVEVLSPSTKAVDSGAKLIGYVQLPSVAHYLIVDPVRHRVIHHRRGEAGLIETRIAADGVLDLTPPGLAIAVADLFEDT
ncbi:Uma2 family endonuclease [Methylobacterium trifolii]|uniref:Putative restriction endonuclease domain-containing protein n=1 Tax=Methylobacterium trifolii TaxID=1003092 RepID=A0ABQ4U421_9HYPH|nr:Uma2 family endonuclease [Methylobacterium trifolii]GJE61788.1 hypothetical protein MPOCJGCO_3914 [Methylobacterium trifolii]